MPFLRSMITKQVKPRVNISSLVPVVQELSAAGRCMRQGRRFIQFCDQAGLPSHPALEQVFMLFAVYLFTQ